LIALGLSGALALSACSGLTPVYGERTLATERQAFRYAEPTNRLEQVIYQELVLRFGRSADASRPLVKITTDGDDYDLTKSGVARPSKARQVTVEAVIEVTAADGRPLLKTTRSASAPFMRDSQALAASEAEKAAYEQAARALAETIRLTLMGTLSQSGA
jgi:hypothetical protein